MIYYYSATGNTRYSALLLGKLLQTGVADILDSRIPEPHDDESVGFMFPIYCWGVPPVVMDFISNHPELFSSDSYLWAACTCGDEAGTAMKSLDRIFLKLRGKRADALFSVIMPNTYVLLPGFDVDKPEVEKSKLNAAPGRLEEIARVIESQNSGVYDVKEGSLPGLRSSIFPIFEKWGVTPKWWHVFDACVGCGKCASVCPASNIRMEASRPSWGDRCFSCCACYHCCPVRAISYSWFTNGKSQYHGPAVSNPD